MDVGILVCTFGDERWRRLGDESYARAADLYPASVFRHHGGDSIADTRNAAAEHVRTLWFCFLDADDELEPGYLEAMTARRPERGLLAPAIREVVDGVPGPARTLDDRNMSTLNPCVIGTLIRRDVFHRVGGFWNERAWEDWSLFRRAWLAGEQVTHVPGAVYRVHVNPTGRNNTVDQPQQLHREILRSHAVWKRKALR